MAQTLTIIIVDKTGSLKTLTVKDYKEEELFKKGGFKKADGFMKHTDWSVKMDGFKYNIALYGKLDGKANMENKFDFPPPVDNKLFFGACVLVASYKNDKGEKVLTNLSIDLWNELYEKLFGGFENLAVTAVEDEEEEDELAHIPKSKKTKKGGYLKDGFVVDSSCSDDEHQSGSSCSDDDSEEFDENADTSEPDSKEEALILEDIGSELSEESYDYSDEEDA